MTIKIAFTMDGTPWTEDYAGIQEEHILADIPEDKAWWRLQYNSETEAVDVTYPTLTDAEAELKLDVDRAAVAEAEAAAEAAAIAAAEAE